jgi:hypothetical protein
VVREGVGQGGEMTQALYAHMNNKTIIIKKINKHISHEACKGNARNNKKINVPELLKGSWPSEEFWSVSLT